VTALLQFPVATFVEKERKVDKKEFAGADDFDDVDEVVETEEGPQSDLHRSIPTISD